jgi:osmotically-inducible protein OsmY
MIFPQRLTPVTRPILAETRMYALTKTVFALAGLSLLAGCAPATVGAGAAGATAVARETRTLGTLIDDQLIELKTASAISNDAELSTQAHINITSYNFIVLISGETPTEALRSKAEQIVREQPKVRRVHNKVSIAAPSSTLTRASDVSLTTRVKAVFIGDEQLAADRVKVVSENGVVYLMGLVTQAEAKLATELTSGVSGVQRIVQLFEITD